MFRAEVRRDQPLLSREVSIISISSDSQKKILKRANRWAPVCSLQYIAVIFCLWVDCEIYLCGLSLSGTVPVSVAAALSFAAFSSLNKAKAYLAQMPHCVPTLVFCINSLQVQTPSSVTQRLICPSVTALQEHMYMGSYPFVGVFE